MFSSLFIKAHDWHSMHQGFLLLAFYLDCNVLLLNDGLIVVTILLPVAILHVWGCFVRKISFVSHKDCNCNKIMVVIFSANCQFYRKFWTGICAGFGFVLWVHWAVFLTSICQHCCRVKLTVKTTSWVKFRATDAGSRMVEKFPMALFEVSPRQSQRLSGWMQGSHAVLKVLNFKIGFQDLEKVLTFAKMYIKYWKSMVILNGEEISSIRAEFHWRQSTSLFMQCCAMCKI